MVNQNRPEVVRWSVFSTTITVTNNEIFSSEIINSMQLNGSIGEFSILSSPGAGYILGPGESVDIIVEFSPSSVGYFSVVLTIVNGGTFDIPLAGTGVSDQSPSETIQDIIDFINVSVSNETLAGSGAGASADGRLNALINMLNQASHLINAGDYDAACTQLSSALMRCDDFVEGTAQSELKQMIAGVMNDLGC